MTTNHKPAAEAFPTSLKAILASDVVSVDECRRSVASLPPDVFDLSDALLAIKDDARRARGIIIHACIAERTGNLSAALQKAERIGVCPQNLRWTGIQKVTSALRRVRGLETLDADFPKRLTSYANLGEFIRLNQSSVTAYWENVRARHPQMARSAFSVAAIACCAHLDAAFPNRVLPEFFASIDWTDDARTTVEIVTGAMSMLLSDSHQRRPFTAQELMHPITPYVYSDEFTRLVNCSILVHNFLNTRNLISLMGYVVEKLESASVTVYNLIPRDIAQHRARILGILMRGEAEMRFARKPDFQMRYADLAKPLQCKLVKHPYLRYRYTIPEMAFFDLYETPTQKLHAEVFRREFLVDVVLEPKSARVGKTSLDQAFIDLGRLSRMAELASSLLVALPRSNRDALMNSFVAALQAKDFATLGGRTDEGELTAQTFANITWGGRSSIDLFYTPFIKVEEHIFFSPPILNAANLKRNILWRNTKDAKRLGTAADRFPEYVADLLRRSGFLNVATEKEIKSLKKIKPEKTNLDVVLLHEDTLWFFECKFNLFGATTYEERDLLEDIAKGVSQVNKAIRILGADPKRTRDYVLSWFPGVRIPRGTVFNLRGGLISSTREYSGLSREGVPIRDVFSLRSTLLSGRIWWLTRQGNDDVQSQPQVFWKGSSFTVDDFVAYWGPSPPVLSLLQGLLVDYTIFSRSDSVVQAELRSDFEKGPSPWISPMPPNEGVDGENST